MKIDYPPELAVLALEGRVLLVWGARWFLAMVEQGVPSLAEHAPPRIAADGGFYTAALPAVVLCASLAELAALTDVGGAYEARKAQCVLVGDGDREADAQLELLVRRAREGWPVLLSASAVGPHAQRFAGCANARVWPFSTIVDLAFHASQLKV